MTCTLFSRSVVAQLFASPWIAARHASLCITNSRSLLKLLSIDLVMPSNHLVLCRPLLLSVFPSIRVFSSEWVLRVRWPKYWNLTFNISSSVNIQDWFSLGLTGLISLQSKGLSRGFSSTTVQKHQFFGRSAFFMIQLSHLYMITGKTIALTRQTFVGKVIPLLFKMLSRLVIAFLPRSKRLLISWLQLPPAMIWEPQRIKFVMFPLFPHLFARKWWDQLPWS